MRRSKRAKSNLEHFSNIQPVNTLLEIHRAGAIEKILVIGKQNLPLGQCQLRQEDKFSFAAIKTIFAALKKIGKIKSTEQICLLCGKKVGCQYAAAIKLNS